MNGNNTSVVQEGRTASLRRHQSQCTVCSSPHRQEIEEAWLDWGNTADLARTYKLSRYAILRHAHCLNWFAEREKRRKKLYEKILERVDLVEFHGSDIVRALRDYSALCAREEAEQTTRQPAQGVLNPVSEPATEAPADDASPLGEPEPRDTSTGETVPASQGNERSEQTVTDLASPEAQNLESATPSTVQ